MSYPLAQISVGVVVERRPAKSPWLQELWRVMSVFSGTPAAKAWTIIDSASEATTYYAGQACIELFRTETANYATNLASNPPLVWVIMRSTMTSPGVELHAVTVDPAEGEALTGSGTDLVETVPMPPSIVQELQRFIIEHHVDRPVYRRQRERYKPT
jgi:hypothetical protein